MYHCEKLVARWEPILIETVREFQTKLGSTGWVDKYKLLDHAWCEYPSYALTLDSVKRVTPSGGGILDIGGHYGLIAVCSAKSGIASVRMCDVYDTFDSNVLEALGRIWKKYSIGTDTVDLSVPSLTLPYESESFHTVVLSAVIEHLPHSPRLLLKEIRRVLKPGGSLIVSTPNGGRYFQRLEFLVKGRIIYSPIRAIYESEIPYTGHHREYADRDLDDVLSWSGFRVEERVYHDLHFADLPNDWKSVVNVRILYPWIFCHMPRLRMALWYHARKENPPRNR